MKVTIPLIVIFLLINACKKDFPSDYIPKNLNDAVDFLDYSWSTSEKEAFKNMTEDSAIFMLNHSTGMGIRNSWGLWKGDTDLANYFNSKRIHEADAMSAMILLSFHRKLNHKRIKFNRQVKEYLEYLRPITEFAERETKRALESYFQYEYGDTISVYLEIDTTSAARGLAVIAMDPEYKWVYNPEKDLNIKGIVLNKNIVEDSTNVELNIRIIEMNKKGIVEIPWGSVKIGDTTIIALWNLKYN